MNKKLIKYFIIVFLISFVIINWNDISWIFNYRFVGGAVSSFVQKDSQNVSVSSIEGNIKQGDLRIPKIDVSAPIVFIDSVQADFGRELRKGVVHFPNSALPGESGQTLILGHSAPPNWPDINYDGIFTDLENLSKGDKIFVFFNNQEYVYSVQEKIFLNRGEEIPKNILTNFDNVLFLISCWPPGKDYKRIAVQAELIK